MENTQIISAVQSGINTKEALTRLYEDNSGLIGYCVRQYYTRPDYEDIRQEAFIALVNAAKEYDTAAGATFSTYAIQHIKWHLYRYFTNQTAAYIPQYVLDDVVRYKQITAAGNRTDTEICHILKINRKRLNDIRKAIQAETGTSIYSHIGNDEGLTLAETIPDDRDDIITVEESTDRERIRQTINAALDRIDPQPAMITRLVYLHNATVKDICKRYNIPYSTAQTYRLRALRELRKVKELKDFYTDYYDSTIYHDSYSHYKNTFSSVVELTAMREYERNSDI